MHYLETVCKASTILDGISPFGVPNQSPHHSLTLMPHADHLQLLPTGPTWPLPSHVFYIPLLSQG